MTTRDARNAPWGAIAGPPRELAALETPVPVVDLDRLAHNLDRMAAYAALHGLALRPHVKTHKAPRVAADQMRLGAVGLTCATPRELEVMADVAGDLLLAYPPVGASRLERFLTLPNAIRLTAGLDSAEAGNMLYAVMPYVEGESLRDRLMGQGRVTTTEAVTIAWEVAEKSAS